MGSVPGMARLPVLHKRRSKTDQALDLTRRAAKMWVTAKLSVKGIRHAHRGAKAYGTAKSTQPAQQGCLRRRRG